MEGVVVDNDDPKQLGRLRIYCNVLDGPKFTREKLPWADYATPFGGFVTSGVS